MERRKDGHTHTPTHTLHTPAVGDDGPGVRRVAGLDPAEEGQEGGRVLGDPVVRPRRELELTDLSLLTGAALGGGTREVILP